MTDLRKLESSTMIYLAYYIVFLLQQIFNIQIHTYKGSGGSNFESHSWLRPIRMLHQNIISITAAALRQLRFLHFSLPLGQAQQLLDTVQDKNKFRLQNFFFWVGPQIGPNPLTGLDRDGSGPPKKTRLVNGLGLGHKSWPAGRV